MKSIHPHKDLKLTSVQLQTLIRIVDVFYLSHTQLYRV